MLFNLILSGLLPQDYVRCTANSRKVLWVIWLAQAVIQPRHRTPNQLSTKLSSLFWCLFDGIVAGQQDERSEREGGTTCHEMRRTQKVLIAHKFNCFYPTRTITKVVPHPHPRNPSSPQLDIPLRSSLRRKWCSTPSSWRRTTTSREEAVTMWCASKWWVVLGLFWGRNTRTRSLLIFRQST